MSGSSRSSSTAPGGSCSTRSRRSVALRQLVAEMGRGLAEWRIWLPAHPGRVLEHRRRLALHRAADLLVRRRGDRPAGRLPVHRQHPDLRGRLVGHGVDRAGAGAGARGTGPGRPHRRPLRRRTRHDAGDRADRRARIAGTRALVAPARAARDGVPDHDPDAGDHRRRGRCGRRVAGGQAGAADLRSGLHLRRARLLAAVRRLLLDHQGLLLRGSHRADLRATAASRPSRAPRASVAPPRARWSPSRW